MDRHADCQRKATADMDPFPILRAGAFVTSLAGVVHSRQSIFLSPTQYTTTRVSFSHVRARSGPTLSLRCACLTARFMPWWAFCVLAYLAPVSSPSSAQLWPCATWMAAAKLTCASSSACTWQVSTAMRSATVSRAAMGAPNGGGVGGKGVQFERAEGGEGLQRTVPCSAVRLEWAAGSPSQACSQRRVSPHTGEELPDCRQFV